MLSFIRALRSEHRVFQVTVLVVGVSNDDAERLLGTIKVGPYDLVSSQYEAALDLQALLGKAIEDTEPV